MEVGEEGDYIYTYRYTVITRMTPALSDESHFNVSLIVRDKVTRQCSQTTTSEEKGEPKSVCLSALPLGQTGSRKGKWPAVSFFTKGPLQ